MNEILLSQSILSDDATAHLRSALPQAPTVTPTPPRLRLVRTRIAGARRRRSPAERVEEARRIAA